MGCWWRADATCSSCVNFPFYFSLFVSHLIASSLWVNALLVGAKAQAFSGPNESGGILSQLLLGAAWAPESHTGWVAADAAVPRPSHSNKLSRCLWTYKGFGELKSWLQIKKAKENQPAVWSRQCFEGNLKTRWVSVDKSGLGRQARSLLSCWNSQVSPFLPQNLPRCFLWTDWWVLLQLYVNL